MSSDYAFRKGKGRSYKAGSFGRLANLDEVYPSFLSFGLIDGDSKSKTSVNAHTSLLNRFLQTGGSSKITRTAGAYGGVGADTVSFAMVGNCHPSMAISMLEGETGSTVTAPHDRIWFFTAPRVLPHQLVKRQTCEIAFILLTSAFQQTWSSLIRGQVLTQPTVPKTNMFSRCQTE